MTHRTVSHSPAVSRAPAHAQIHRQFEEALHFAVHPELVVHFKYFYKGTKGHQPLLRHLVTRSDGGESLLLRKRRIHIGRRGKHLLQVMKEGQKVAVSMVHHTRHGSAVVLPRHRIHSVRREQSRRRLEVVHRHRVAQLVRNHAEIQVWQCHFSLDAGAAASAQRHALEDAVLLVPLGLLATK